MTINDARETLLAVIIPVKEINAVTASALTVTANSATKLKFIAVGKVTAPVATVPNLQIVDVDCSLYDAMNKGTCASTSEYLLYMGIDDILIASNVNSTLDALSKWRTASMVVLPFKVGNRLVSQAHRGRVASFHHQGVLFQRTAVLALGGYSNAFRLHADLDLMFRLQRSHGEIANLSLPIVSFSKGGASTSGRHAIESIREFNAIYKVHRVSRISFNFMFSISLLLAYRLRWMLRRLVE